jgi:hypothetical protein
LTFDPNFTPVLIWPIQTPSQAFFLWLSFPAEQQNTELPENDVDLNSQEPVELIIA